MRDKLIHDYMGINYLIVWDVVKNKIPQLQEQIDKVIEDSKQFVFASFNSTIYLSIPKEPTVSKSPSSPHQPHHLSP